MYVEPAGVYDQLLLHA